MIQYVPPHHGTVVQNWSPDHPGLDFACLRGSPVVAAHSGELTHGRNGRMGIYAYVTRGNTRTYYAHLQSVAAPGWYEQGELTHGRNGRMGIYAYVTRGNTRTYYAHLQSVSPPGWYEQGEQIATCGSTGSWSTGPHLHFESNVPYTF